jgi:hypothetical protein
VLHDSTQDDALASIEWLYGKQPQLGRTFARQKEKAPALAGAR